MGQNLDFSKNEILKNETQEFLNVPATIVSKKNSGYRYILWKTNFVFLLTSHRCYTRSLFYTLKKLGYSNPQKQTTVSKSYQKSLIIKI